MRAMLAVFSFMIVVAIGARYIVSRCESRMPKPTPSPAKFVASPPAPKPANKEMPEVSPIYREFHAYNAERFGMQKGFGAARVEPAVQFHSIFKYSLPERSGTLLVKQLELLGSLDGNPIVYSPRMLQFDPYSQEQIKLIAGSERRPMNAFEVSALEKLRSGKDVVVKENGNRANVMGALRAKTSCAKCHDVHEGELLGALIYAVEKAKDGQYDVMR